MSVMREVAQLQESYQALVDEKRLSKRAMCSLCIPFRDKYGLTGRKGGCSYLIGCISKETGEEV